MARASRQLKSLSIAYQSDAYDFFYEFLRNYRINASPDFSGKGRWENLHTLSLTSLSLREGPTPAEERLQVGRFLRTIHLVVEEFMPQLEVIQIWRCGNGSGACFTVYLIGLGEIQPSITWISTWPTPLMPQSKAFRCWSDLVRQRDTRGREPRVSIVTITTLPADQLQSPWGFSRYLIRSHIFHIRTRHQIEWETFGRNQNLKSI
jgi:hypothetical protein